jgi:hypothetical protein
MVGRPKLANSDRIGCGYLLKLTLLISLLMIGNSYLVGLLVGSTVHLLPEVLDDIRLYQFFQIFVPILMVCLQFWIYDRLKDRWLASSQAGD